MSRNKNGSIRCDDCGRLTGDQDGYYQRPDGTAGYINSKGQDSEFDYCEECAEGRCPYCMSDQWVKTTPIIPGPDGWGGRCKVCGKEWGRFPETEELRELGRMDL